MSSFLRLLLALGILGAFLYGVWWAFATAVSWITAQQSEVAAAIIGFAATVIAGTSAVLISQQRSKSRDIAESHRPKKTELYSGFIKNTIGMLRKYAGSVEAGQEVPKDIEEFFFQFTTEAVLWGSPRVLRHYATFRQIGQKRSSEALLFVDDLMQAMRKDLGLSNRGLRRGDLIKLFLTDPESVDKLLSPPDEQYT